MYLGKIGNVSIYYMRLKIIFDVKLSAIIYSKQPFIVYVSE